MKLRAARIGKTLWRAAGIVLLGISLCAAQVSTSTINGLVQDAEGLLVVGAKVVAQNEATGVSYETTTTSAGTYTLSALPPGSYTITVSHGGFRTFTSLHNILTVGAPLVVDAKLDLGQVSEVVQVEASYERLDTSSAMLSGVVGRKEVVELPLNGRNPLNLIVLEPGLVQRSTKALGAGTHVFGSRDRAHNLTIDGIDANESSVPNPQSNIYRLTPDNVQEYRVVTHNATPEFGRNSGSSVTIATRAGTNEFHGDAYYFHRNTVLNSNEFFNGASGLTRPTLLLHQYGGDFGGPIIKNKTFFFGSYQGNRIAQTQPISQSFGIPLVYTKSARNGIFRFVRGTINAGGSTVTQNSTRLVDSSGNLLPGVPVCGAPSDSGSVATINCVDSYDMFANDPARIGPDPLMRTMIGSFPLPNSFSSGDGLNTAGFIWNPPSRFTGPFYLMRIDHKFDDNNNIFARYLGSEYDTTQGDFLNGRPSIFPGFAPLGEVFRTGQNLAVSYRRVFSPRLVNEFTTGYSRFHFLFSLVESNQPSNPPPYGQECFGTTSLRNIDTPFCNTPHTERAVSNIQFIDNLSYTVGAHTIRGGINFRFYRHNDFRGVPGGFNEAPTIIFDQSVRSPASDTAPGIGAGFPTVRTIQGTSINGTDNTRLLNAIVEIMGIPARIQQAFQADLGNNVYTTQLFVMGTREKQFDTYIQDEWKVRRDLTFTYGLRWEWNRPPTDCCGRTFVPDRPIDGSQGPVTFVKADSWFGRDNATALAPRVSVAWNPRGRKTVVRAGWGIAFDTISTFQVTAISGKVPGSTLQCRVDINGTATSGCIDVAGKANLRLSQLLQLVNPFTLQLPTARPGTNFSPPPQPRGIAPDVGAFNPNLKIPTVHEWNLTVQRQLPWGIVGQVGYVGKRGTRLFHSYDLNQIFTNQPGFSQDFLNAQNNLSICINNSAACLAAQAAAGIAASSRTATNFANFGLPGQVNLPVINALLGAASNTSSAFRGSNATDVSQNGIGNFANRADQANIVARGFPANFFRPNPQFGQIFNFDNSGDSIYHGMIVELQRRFERGLTFGFAYTLAKSIDDLSVDPVGATSGGGLTTTNSRTPVDVRHLSLERSRSDFDDRHVVVANSLYELPFGRRRHWGSGWNGALNHVLGGWTVTGIYLFQSGEPFSIDSGIFTQNNAKVSRADIRGPFVQPQLQFISGVTGPVVYNAGPLITNINDPNFNCRQVVGTQTFFCIPPPGGTGAGRNLAQGPGFWNMDLGLLKDFNITERVKLQFRTEFFNVFNHPNFENPRNATVGTPRLTSASTFGQACCVTSAVSSSATVIALGEPNRVIQFAFKINF